MVEDEVQKQEEKRTRKLEPQEDRPKSYCSFLPLTSLMKASYRNQSPLPWSLLKIMSIESVMPSNHHPLLSPSPLAFNISQHQGLFKWVSSLHEVARVSEFQLQHQSFQWIFRTDFLSDGLVGFPCRRPQEPERNIRWKVWNTWEEKKTYWRQMDTWFVLSISEDTLRNWIKWEEIVKSVN